MANSEHIEILKKGVEHWNEWRKENPNLLPDLYNANFNNMSLIDYDFNGANLSTAILNNSNLHKSTFIDSHLEGIDIMNSIFTQCIFDHSNIMAAKIYKTDLRYSEFFQTDFSGANLGICDFSNSKIKSVDLTFTILSETNFFRCDFEWTDFSYSNFDRVNFLESNMGGNKFNNTDFRKALNLDKVNHLYPSSIGIDSIFKSQGIIPIIFLKGAGVHEKFIEYIPSFANQPFQFYTCFISHSTNDKIFCERLYNDLQAKGVRCWFFPEDAKWGKKVWGEIDRGIKIYDKLMVVCSKNSLQSEPVIREMERALQREDTEHKNILFPIRIDNFIFDKWEHERKADVVSKVVGDFCGWDKDVNKYNKSLNKLIKALKAE